jgi:Tfp pilus assembly protein PilF
MARELQNYLERAHQQLGQNNAAAAIETLRMALTIDPEHAHAHALLAICLQNEKRLYAAEYEAGQALTLEPESAFSHYAMALVLMSKRKLAQAETHLQRCIALDPDNAEYLRMLARLNDLWGRSQQVMAMLEKARDMDPNNPDVWADIARYYYFEQNDPLRAQESLQYALSLQPEHGSSLVTMGFVLLHQGRVEDARQHALWALRQNPRDEYALNLFCSVQARKSLTLGLWWRINKFFGSGSITRMTLMLVGAYIVYRFAEMLLGDYGNTNLRLALQIAWFSFFLYTWIGPRIFARQMQKELQSVKLDSRY